MKPESKPRCLAQAFGLEEVRHGSAISALLIVLLLAGRAHAQTSITASAAPSCGESMQVQALFEEVRALRALVLTWKLETQTERTKILEQTIQGLRGEKAQLQQEERNAEQQLATLVAQIQSVKLGSEQHLQLEAEKLLATSETNAYRQKSADLATREAGLNHQLSTELRHTAELRAQLNSIAKPR